MFLIKVKFNFKCVSKMKGNYRAYKIEEIQSSDGPGSGKRFERFSAVWCVN